MSGGSYNYLCYQMDAQGHLDLGDLEAMCNRLREFAPGSAATKETEKLYDTLNALVSPALAEVWHAIEWLDSCDYVEDQAIAAVRQYEVDANEVVESYDLAAERDKLARAIHRCVNSSRIGATVPYLVGDAERAVVAVIIEGWSPPPGYAAGEPT